MNASEMITKLQEFINKYGDYPVVDEHNESVNVEFDDGRHSDLPPAFVVSPE